MIDKAWVGPFQILNRLGTNRRHRVYRALQAEQHREVALKFIHPPPDMDRRKVLSRIQREVSILKSLQHPNLVHVYGAGVADGDIFFACELIRGESLTARLSRRGSLATDLVVEFGAQIADVLAYLHDHEIVHGKLTPDKILIDEHETVHLSDVRLNRARRRSWDASHRRELDAVGYLAPEQFNEGATAKSDLYALGAIMFEMLTGRLPLEPNSIARVYQQKMTSQPPSVSTIKLDCPIWLDRLVAALLDANPARRPHSARAVYYALLEIQKVDQNRTAVVDQMAGGFNPLTVGADKTEARRLLGQLKERPDRQPLMQRTSVQLVALMVVLAAIAYLVWPVSNESLFRRSVDRLQSNQVQEVIRARDGFRQIVDRNKDDRWTSEARLLINDAQERILLLNAQAGIPAREKNASLFMDAYAAEQQGNHGEALRLYHRLIDKLDGDAQFGFVADASRQRIEEIGTRTAARRAAENSASASGPSEAQ